VAVQTAVCFESGFLSKDAQRVSLARKTIVVPDDGMFRNSQPYQGGGVEHRSIGCDMR